MARNAPDPETVQMALEMASTGMSDADVATEMTSLGVAVSEGTIGTWRKRYGDGPKRTTASPEAKAKIAARRVAVPADPEAADDSIDDDPLRALQKMQAQMQRDAATARAVGNVTAAQRSMTAAAGLAPVIARLLHASKDDASTLRISRVEIAQRRADGIDRVRKILERPLLCAKCSRELSICWAGVEPAKGDGGVHAVA
jgi:hypothetical protein